MDGLKDREGTASGGILSATGDAMSGRATQQLAADDRRHVTSHLLGSCSCCATSVEVWSRVGDQLCRVIRDAVGW